MLKRLHPPFGVLLILLLAFPYRSGAEFVWTSGCLDAYEAANRFDFENAADLLKNEKRAKPGNLIPLLIEGRIDFLHIFALEETDRLEGMKRACQVRINAFEKDRSGSAYRRLCMAEMYLLQGMARLKASEYFGAVYDIRKAYRLLEENRKMYPSFLPTLKGLGFLHALIGTIPENFRWVTALLGMDGSISGGLRELGMLHRATLTDPSLRYLQEESAVLLTVLGLNLGNEKNYEALKKRLNNMREVSRRPLLSYALAGVYQHAGENDSILVLLRQMRLEGGQYRLPHLHYLEGNALLQRHDRTARNCYLTYLNRFKGRSYTLAARQRMAWSRLIQNDADGYREEMERLKNLPLSDALTDEDKAALEEAKNGIPPNPILLRARLFFDGGYYSSALQEIAGKPLSAFPGMRDQLELTYRLARIFEKQGNHAKAIEYYVLTLKNGEKRPWYFAANSALLLGQLHEESGRPDLAGPYYRKALELRNHEYQNSIDQKAKAGLNRLRGIGG